MIKVRLGQDESRNRQANVSEKAPSVSNKIAARQRLLKRKREIVWRPIRFSVLISLPYGTSLRCIRSLLPSKEIDAMRLGGGNEIDDPEGER